MPKTKLVSKLSLVFTVTGGWHVTLCETQKQLNSLSHDHFDLIIADQNGAGIDMTSMGDTPVMLIIENAHGLQSLQGVNVIDKINLSLYPIVSLAEKIRTSFHQYVLKEYVL